MLKMLENLKKPFCRRDGLTAVEKALLTSLAGMAAAESTDELGYFRSLAETHLENLYARLENKIEEECMDDYYSLLPEEKFKGGGGYVQL